MIATDTTHLCDVCADESRCWHTGWRWVCSGCWLRLFGRDPQTGEAVA